VTREVRAVRLAVGSRDPEARRQDAQHRIGDTRPGSPLEPERPASEPVRGRDEHERRHKLRTQLGDPDRDRRSQAVANDVRTRDLLGGEDAQHVVGVLRDGVRAAARPLRVAMPAQVDQERRRACGLDRLDARAKGEAAPAEPVEEHVGYTGLGRGRTTAAHPDPMPLGHRHQVSVVEQLHARPSPRGTVAATVPRPALWPPSVGRCMLVYITRIRVR
jgi:hypothetical protein